MDQCKKDIYDKYDELRRFYKDQIFDKTDDALLDRHKVASCMCAAFLQVSVFNKERMVRQIINTKEAVHSFFFYANELVALYAANRFLSFFMVMDYRGDLKLQKEIMRKLLKEPYMISRKYKIIWKTQKVKMP